MKHKSRIHKTRFRTDSKRVWKRHSTQLSKRVGADSVRYRTAQAALAKYIKPRSVGGAA